MEKFQMKSSYLQRKIVDSDVLISVGENIADFNGYIELNTSAAFLCNELKASRTVEELAAAFQDKFQISYEQAMEDVQEFLAELRQKDMVIVS